MSPRALAVPVLCALACGPVVDAEPMSADASGDTTFGETEGPTSSGPATTGEAMDETTASTPGIDSGGPAPGYEDDDGGTGCTFTCPDPPPGPGGGSCSLLEQDCSEDQKCMPWDPFGEGIWSATRCSWIADEPGEPGEPCIVEGNALTGIDSCDLGSVCWQVDPKTNDGICHALCAQVEGLLTCEDPAQSCAQLPGDVPLCVHACDPVAPDCEPYQGCQLSGGDDTFICRPPPEVPVPIGEVCDDPGVCAVGSLCAFGLGIDCGNEPGQGCCAEICEVGAGACSDPGAACVPWIPFDPPSSLAHIGVCAG